MLNQIDKEKINTGINRIIKDIKNALPKDDKTIIKGIEELKKFQLT